MITHDNLPQLLGPQYDPKARYCMVEFNKSDRGGRFPSRRTAMARSRLVPLEPEGNWKSLGEFSDPEVSSARSFTIYCWEPKPANVPSYDVPSSCEDLPK